MKVATAQAAKLRSQIIGTTPPPANAKVHGNVPPVE
jgi:hypothetical protein